VRGLLVAFVDAEDQFLWVFSVQLQLTGVGKAWAPNTTAELLTVHMAESGSVPLGIVFAIWAAYSFRIAGDRSRTSSSAESR
jgi:hypothetical protein